jgi:excisionase family DNA binding protein
MAQPMADKWLRPADAARYLGVSKTTLRRWERAGVLRVEWTRGGHRRYRQSELERQFYSEGKP